MDPTTDPLSYAPPGYPTVVPCLRVRGASKLLDFVTAAFNAEILDRTTNERGALIYSAVKIGTEVVEISEASDRFDPVASLIHVYLPDTTAAHKAAMDAGGEEIYPPQAMHYGELSSGVADPFGNHWYLATRLERPAVRAKDEGWHVA